MNHPPTTSSTPHPVGPPQDHELQAYCRRHKIHFQGYSTLGTQWLSRTNGRNPVLEHPEIVQIAAAHGRSPALVVLRWALQHSQVGAVHRLGWRGQGQGVRQGGGRSEGKPSGAQMGSIPACCNTAAPAFGGICAGQLVLPQPPAALSAPPRGCLGLVLTPGARP